MTYENDLPIDLVAGAYSGTSFVPEQRARQVRADYSAHLESFRALLEPLATSDELRALVDAQFERYRQNYRKHFSAWLAAKSRIVSPMIAGPSNFPVRRMEKRNRSEQNRYDDLIRWQERARRAVIRILKRASAQDPVADLRTLLAKRERYQEQGKAVNAIIRKYRKDPEKAVAVMMQDLKLSEYEARKFLEPDFCNRVGVPDYSLRNNLANIKRIRERIAELEAKEQARAEAEAQGSEPQTTEFRGGKIVENLELDRLQILFPGKPSDAVRTLLKKNGFRWAPSEGAWQRQLTGNARWAARHVVAQIEATTC